MKKVGFVMSSVFTVIGIILVALGRLIQALLPKIGWMVFKASGPGSYSPQQYVLNLQSYYIVAVICILGGIVFSVAFYLSEAFSEKRELSE